MSIIYIFRNINMAKIILRFSKFLILQIVVRSMLKNYNVLLGYTFISFYTLPEKGHIFTSNKKERENKHDGYICGELLLFLIYLKLFSLLKNSLFHYLLLHIFLELPNILFFFISKTAAGQFCWLCIYILMIPRILACFSSRLTHKFVNYSISWNLFCKNIFELYAYNLYASLCMYWCFSFTNLL